MRVRLKHVLRVLPLLPLALVLLGTAPAPHEASTFVGTFDHYAVAADQATASEAGAEVLAAGGTAADAAAATMVALGVVNPASSGLGGGGFALYYRASDHSLTFLDFRERAPAAATPDMYDHAPAGEGLLAQASQLGGLASGVPGEPAGIVELVQRFGALPLSKDVEPGALLAEHGSPAPPYVAHWSGPFATQMKRDPVMAGWFPGGAPTIRAGQVLTRPALARTIRLLGRRGAAGFYGGAVARAIIAANHRVGGIMTLADLRDYAVVQRTPLVEQHFGYRWATAPLPSAGGYTMLQSLTLLERWLHDPRRTPEPLLLHAMAESWKGAYLDRQAYFGDPDHVQVPLAALRADGRIAARAAVYRQTLAMPPSAYALPLPRSGAAQQPVNEHGTSHLCVVDAQGNVASVTTTVNLPFGARYTADGVVMNDEMDDFARGVGAANAFGLPGGAPNLPGPGKRPISTMSPTIVLAGNQPVLCVGAAGGSRIVTATEQVAFRTLVLGMDPAEAMRAPRIHHQGVPDVLEVEAEHPIDAQARNGLEARGHDVETSDSHAVVQAIRITLDDQGVRHLTAVTDPRKDGLPAGE